VTYDSPKHPPSVLAHGGFARGKGVLHPTALRTQQNQGVNTPPLNWPTKRLIKINGRRKRRAPRNRYWPLPSSRWPRTSSWGPKVATKEEKKRGGPGTLQMGRGPPSSLQPKFFHAQAEAAYVVYPTAEHPRRTASGTPATHSDRSPEEEGGKRIIWIFRHLKSKWKNVASI